MDNSCFGRRVRLLASPHWKHRNEKNKPVKRLDLNIWKSPLSNLQGSSVVRLATTGSLQRGSNELAMSLSMCNFSWVMEGFTFPFRYIVSRRSNVGRAQGTFQPFSHLEKMLNSSCRLYKPRLMISCAETIWQISRILRAPCDRYSPK